MKPYTKNILTITDENIGKTVSNIINILDGKYHSYKTMTMMLYLPHLITQQRTVRATNGVGVIKYNHTSSQGVQLIVM